MVSNILTVNFNTALECAKLSSLYATCCASAGARLLRLYKFAYLNRACELACAPVHLRPVETSNGIDYAWYTYRPVAQEPKRFLGSGESRPNRLNLDFDLQWQSVPAPSEIEAVYLGLESTLTEDQARSRAMGY